MNYCSQRHTKWALLLILLPLLWVCSAEGKGIGPVPRRIRRQINVCQDGIYTVDGKTCCLCAAGMRLTKDCAAQEDRTCEFCETGKTYKSRPTNDRTCEPCTTCGQDNAHLEVKENCTTAKNAVCQCQEGFYCDSQPCTICNPCENCVGKTIKIRCSRTNNTVCDDKTDGHGLILSVILVPSLILIVCVIIYCWKKKRLCFNISGPPSDSGPEIQKLKTREEIQEGDLTRKVPAIAGVIGWADMKRIALASGITQVSIDNIMRDNTMCSEQTEALLMAWVQRQGMAAPPLIVEHLSKMKRKDTMQKVRNIILEN